MSALAVFARVAAVLLLGALLLTTAFLLLAGGIRTAGLLDDKAKARFDPARLQLLVSSVLLAGLTLTRLPEMRAAHLIALPSNELLFLLGGSQGVYLVRKFMQQRIPH